MEEFGHGCPWSTASNQAVELQSKGRVLIANGALNAGDIYHQHKSKLVSKINSVQYCNLMTGYLFSLFERTVAFEQIWEKKQIPGNAGKHHQNFRQDKATRVIIWIHTSRCYREGVNKPRADQSAIPGLRSEQDVSRFFVNLGRVSPETLPYNS